jgi:hypothetical protein
MNVEQVTSIKTADGFAIVIGHKLEGGCELIEILRRKVSLYCTEREIKNIQQSIDSGFAVTRKQ